MQPVSPAEFEGYVADALDQLPPELAARFSNVVLVVEDENEEEPDLLGLYEGVALTEREHYSGALPDRISLYRIPGRGDRGDRGARVRAPRRHRRRATARPGLGLTVRF